MEGSMEGKIDKGKGRGDREKDEYMYNIRARSMAGWREGLKGREKKVEKLVRWKF